MINEFGISSSKDIQLRRLKMVFWGDTGTRKTETPLRFFPHCLVIDAEGNVDQCVGVPEIPEFLKLKTQDTRKVVEIIKAVGVGKIKFDDGSPVETLVIDSTTVLWSVQQEVAAKQAEKRAHRYNKPIADATVTQIDWTTAKRPFKELSNAINATTIKYFVIIARQKDLTEEDDKGNTKKIGVTLDAVKGTTYDANLAMRFYGGKEDWSCEVTKVQGALGNILPMGSRMKKFPADEILKYSETIKPEAEETKSESEVAEKILENEDKAQKSTERSQKALIELAHSQGIPSSHIGSILKNAGIITFDANRWDEMTTAIVSANGGGSIAG